MILDEDNGLCTKLTYYGSMEVITGDKNHMCITKHIYCRIYIT